MKRPIDRLVEKYVALTGPVPMGGNEYARQTRIAVIRDVAAIAARHDAEEAIEQYENLLDALNGGEE